MRPNGSACTTAWRAPAKTAPSRGSPRSEDRYGQLPDEVEALFLCAQIRWRAGQLGASQVQATAQGAGEHYKLTLAPTLDGTEGGIDPTTLVRWVAERPQQARPTASTALISDPLPKQIARRRGPARAALNFCETLCALQPDDPISPVSRRCSARNSSRPPAHHRASWRKLPSA